MGGDQPDPGIMLLSVQRWPLAFVFSRPDGRSLDVPIDGETAVKFILELCDAPQVKEELDRRQIRVILPDSKKRSLLRRFADACKSWRR